MGGGASSSSCCPGSALPQFLPLPSEQELPALSEVREGRPWRAAQGQARHFWGFDLTTSCRAVSDEEREAAGAGAGGAGRRTKAV